MSLRRTLRHVPLVLAMAMIAVPVTVRAEGDESLEKRVEKLEVQASKNRVHLSGDYRCEAHSIESSIPDHYDGMMLQNLMVNTLCAMNYMGPEQGRAAFPTPDMLNEIIRAHYSDYLYFTNNLTFDGLKQAVGSFPPEMQQQLMQFLSQYTFTKGYDVNNSILYTNRLRLNFSAEVAPNIDFAGRLAMYKVWGDSTGVQVFNGQPNSINLDGTTVGAPNSDILRVERAYFDWKDIGGTPLYLSIGRRPSTQGAPNHLRQDELRGGTPLGSVVDYQFDGITLGYHLSDTSTARLCYGIGYESGFGNGFEAARSLKDAAFLGANWDVYNTDTTFVQATVARAMNVTDGFNGLVVLPVDPVTGNQIKAPVVLRFTPSSNLGDIDLASIVLIRRDGPLDWFISGNYSKTHPLNVTTPFGGLLSDPFDVPEEHSGNMIWAGARLNLNEDRTKIGLEYNHGSQYWFNFANAEDDIVAPKSNTRGSVFEAYVTHRVSKRFIVKFDVIHYAYDYSGSGWHVGAPKKLDETPMLGFPTYDKVTKFALSMMARF